jgi:hypothetical protein
VGRRAPDDRRKLVVKESCSLVTPRFSFSSPPPLPHGVLRQKGRTLRAWKLTQMKGKTQVEKEV